jgi:hypothetical protein
MNRWTERPDKFRLGGTAITIYTYYDKIYTVPGIGRAPPGKAQKACLLGALVYGDVGGSRQDRKAGRH